MAIQHDSAYKELFSNRTMIEFLIRLILPQTYVNRIDFQAIERYPTESISKNKAARKFKVRVNDLMWKLKLTDGEDLYVLLMVEMQSKVDHSMPIRIGEYILNWYLLLYHVEKMRRLPLIVPVVLYNGSSPWIAATSLQDMMDIPHEMEPMVETRYIVIDEHRLYESGQLPMDNPVGALLSSIHTSDAEEHWKSFARAHRMIAEQGESEVFLQQMSSFILDYKRIKKSKRLKKFIEQQGVENMTKTYADWEKEFRQEGIQEGVQKGRQEGIQEGRQEGALAKARESAELMVNDGRPEHEVHRYTGLSIDEIRQMKQGF